MSRSSSSDSGDLPARLIEARPRARVVAELLSSRLELERERDQPLLRAVVEVALQPLALLLPGLEHSRARAPQLVEARAAARRAVGRSRARCRPPR